MINDKSLYRVEYFSTISEKSALEYAKNVYKKVFSEDVDDNEIVLKKKDSLD
jgi:hypothetical protein